MNFNYQIVHKALSCKCFNFCTPVYQWAWQQAA